MIPLDWCQQQALRAKNAGGRRGGKRGGKFRESGFDTLRDDVVGNWSAARMQNASKRRRMECCGVPCCAMLRTLGHRVGVRRKQRVADRDPRRQSRIRLHVFIPFAAARSRIPGIGVIAQTRGGRLELDGPFVEHRAGQRAPGTLTLRGSWPGLPVWIDIEPWWRQQTIVTLSLRSTHRVRYPRRYFSGSHRVLRQFVATLART